MPDTGCTECVVCGRNAEKRCGRCRGAAYCGRQHQSLHWRVHRPICSSSGPRSPTLLLLDDTLLLVFRLLQNEDLVTAGQVCARWRRLARQPALWAKRRLERRDHDDDDQVLRVLRFAPRLAELDSEWTSLRWPPDYEEMGVEEDDTETGPYELEILAVKAAVEVSRLRVYQPGPLLLPRFGSALQELAITTSNDLVLHQLGQLAQFGGPGLKRLSLRWDDSGRSGVALLRDHEKLLKDVAERHTNALHSLLGWRQWSGDVSSSSELLAALARCPGLRELWVPASLQAPHLSLLAAMPLRLLVLDCCDLAVSPGSPVEPLPGLVLPPTLQTLSVKVQHCPLEQELARKLGRVCARLPGLQEVRVRPYVPRDEDRCDLPAQIEPDQPQPLGELRAALGPNVEVCCHCNCELYDFGDPRNHQAPPEDRTYDVHFNMVDGWDYVMNNMAPGVLDDFDDSSSGDDYYGDEFDIE